MEKAEVEFDGVPHILAHPVVWVSFCMGSYEFGLDGIGNHLTGSFLDCAVSCIGIPFGHQSVRLDGDEVREKEVVPAEWNKIEEDQTDVLYVVVGVVGILE